MGGGELSLEPTDQLEPGIPAAAMPSLRPALRLAPGQPVILGRNRLCEIRKPHSVSREHATATAVAGGVRIEPLRAASVRTGGTWAPAASGVVLGVGDVISFQGYAYAVTGRGADERPAKAARVEGAALAPVFARAAGGAGSGGSGREEVEGELFIFESGSRDERRGGSASVMALDLDWTVIKPTSGKKTYARNGDGATDWAFWHAAVPAKIQALHREGHRIAFFTNANVDKPEKLERLRRRYGALAAKLRIPFVVYAGIQPYRQFGQGRSAYRKPALGGWERFCANELAPASCDRARSIFVGDAAGRPAGWAPGMKEDFACTDRMFAANAGLRFATPEEFFLGQRPVDFAWGQPVPAELLQRLEPRPDPPKVLPPAAAETTPELVVLSGCPASGKSTLAEGTFAKAGYAVVSRDQLGTMVACSRAAAEHLRTGRSVVIDNTKCAPGAALAPHVAHPPVAAAQRATPVLASSTWRARPVHPCGASRWMSVATPRSAPPRTR